MIAALCLLPALAGAAAFLARSRRVREALLVGAALAHAAGVAHVGRVRPPPELDGWIGLDALGLLFLGLVSALFLAAAFYAVGYLRREPERSRRDVEEPFWVSNEPESVFVGCLLLFLASMTLVTVSRHVGLLWVGVEATTLASAPLIYFHRQHRSLEAAWKYLLVCSVGIGLALVGTLFLAAAAEGISEEAASLRLDDLLVHARELRVVWLEGAFLLLLVGYGTKMGLAPMHTWLPDAHSESPSLVSALLSGALLNCAFLGILRVHQVLVAAGAAELASGPLVAIGLISMATAAVFVVAQPDFKRMLAYSSVEHMGVLALGVGLGGPAVAGALLHAAAHSFTKATLFLSAGNLMAVYLTKRAADVRGALARTPRTAALWIAGLLAITGVPPFGLFVSEFAILRGALAGGQLAVAAIYLLLLAAVFVAMIGIGLPMAFGAVPGRPAERESWSATAPPAALALVALLLGVHQPLALRRLLEDAARLLGAP